MSWHRSDTGSDRSSGSRRNGKNTISDPDPNSGYDPPDLVCPNEDLVAQLAADFLKAVGKGEDPDPKVYVAKLPTAADREKFEVITGMGILLRLVLS